MDLHNDENPIPNIMTDFEKKLKRYHNKKMKYNKDSQTLIYRLRRKEAEKYDFAETQEILGQDYREGFRILEENCRPQMNKRPRNPRALCEHPC